jgi:hypothetical protein
MKPGGLLLFAVLALLPARAADAESIVAPANLLVPGRISAAWRPLLDALASKGAIYALFEEDRYFPFRKTPVVLRGEIRLSPRRGLSLHYTYPEERTLIVDGRGALLRDETGRNHELPADARAQAAMHTLLEVLRFNLPALAPSFDLYGVRADGGWKFVFAPRAGEMAGVLSRLEVAGAGDEVQTIEMRRSALTRVEIRIRDAQAHAAFTPAETAKFFR